MPRRRLVPVPDTWARAAKLDVPMLAVNGALYPNMECPDAYNEIIKEYLS